MKPIIGLIAEVDDKQITKIGHRYTEAIEKNGGIPILLPYVTDDETVKRYIELCDGFLFTGGVDVHPKYYGEEVKSTCGTIQNYRDEFDFKVLSEVLKAKKPILAICRGAQLINVALGGSLYQDLPTEYETNIQHRQTEALYSQSHIVNVIAGTPLEKLTRMPTIPANSFHHQAIKKLGEGLEIMAKADDGIIEAVYLNGENYLRAYQWHPERLFDTDKYNGLIFEDFIKVCKQ